MKKATHKKLFIILGVILFSIVLSSCSKHEHTFDYFYDDNFHWKECECGKKLEQEEHIYELFNDDDQIYEKCTVCGKSNQKHEHTFNYFYDDNYHWKECECGKKLEQEEHTYELFNENDVVYEKCTVCGKSNQISVPTNYKEITNAEIISGLMYIKLDYEYFVPGIELSYKCVWDGYDRPGLQEDKLNTYLTEYKEIDNKFYLVYIKNDLISSYKTFLKSYEKEAYDLNYHFSSYDNEQIIDGKYFYCFQKANSEPNEDIKFFETDNLEDIKFKFNNYQLVFCARSKQAIIKENLSTSKSLNKEIVVYSRYELEFEDINSYPKFYEFDLPEKTNQNIIKEMFDYVGEMIEPYPQTYENLKYSYVPTLGFGEYFSYINVRVKVVTKDNKKYVYLPRYAISGDKNLDLLSDEIDFLSWEDVFGEYKALFAEALVPGTETTESLYIMALYDYDKVKDIISRGE